MLVCVHIKVHSPFAAAMFGARLRGPAWDAPLPAALLAAQALADPAEVAARVQGGDSWKLARYGELSGSTAAYAAGLMGPAGQLKWIVDMTWPDYAGLYGSAARSAAVGTAGEPVAKSVYEAHRRAAGVVCELTGFCMHAEHRWLGASPDLVIHEPVGAGAAPPAVVSNPHWLAEPYVISHPDGPDAYVTAIAAAASSTAAAVPATVPGQHMSRGTGEIKCIASKDQLFYSEQPRHKRYGIPTQYYVQVQVQCEVLDTDWNDVIVHLPTRTQVIRFRRNRQFFHDELLPALKHAYFDLFLPQLEARVTGVLWQPQTLHEPLLPAGRMKPRLKDGDADAARAKTPPRKRAAGIDDSTRDAFEAFFQKK